MTLQQQELLTMSMWLLVTMMGSGAIAAWFLRRFFSLAFIIGAFVVSIALIFVAIPVAHSANVPIIFFVASLFGASIAANFGGLWILIGLGVAGIVGWISQRAEYFIGIGAAIFWGIYMIYDFNKVVDLYSEATWPAAMEIAMNLYLDIINFLIRILPYVLDALADS